MQGPVRKPVVRVERWSPEEKDVSIGAPLPFYLGLRMLNYPAWRAEINGKMLTPLGGEDYNQMVIWVPAGQSNITVRFTRTWDRTAGGIASLAGLVVAGWLVLRRRFSEL
jgi:hypothetical protein